MNYRRYGLRSLGLSLLAAFSLMAFTAAGARAGAGEWLIEDKTVAELPGELESVTAEVEGLGRLLILKLNLLLKCETIQVSEAHIVPTGHAAGSILFDDCYYTSVSGLVKNQVCEVDHFATEVLALLIKHEGAAYILFTPLVGQAFLTMQNLGEECSLPKSLEVKGSVVAEIKVKDKIVNLISTKSTLTLFPNDVITYGTHVSHLETDATVQLAGNDEGGTWGYHLL